MSRQGLRIKLKQKVKRKCSKHNQVQQCLVMKVTKTTVAKGTTERLSERVIQKELDIRSAVTEKTNQT